MYIAQQSRGNTEQIVEEKIQMMHRKLMKKKLGSVVDVERLKKEQYRKLYESLLLSVKSQTVRLQCHHFESYLNGFQVLPFEPLGSLVLCCVRESSLSADLSTIQVNPLVSIVLSKLSQSWQALSKMLEIDFYLCIAYTVSLYFKI